MSKEIEILTIVQAYLDGKIVKYRFPKTVWMDIDEYHGWDFTRNEYKILVPREYMLELNKDGTVRDVLEYNDKVDYGLNSIRVREVV